MYYKKDEKGNWHKGKIIYLPSGEILNEDNKNSLDGWEWHDEAPQEYLEWLESKQTDDLI